MSATSHFDADTLGRIADAGLEPEKLPEFGWFPLDALPTPLSRFAADAVKALEARHLARNAAS